MSNTRHFTVKGTVSCVFQPGTTPETIHVAGLEVQLWHKGPMDIIHLGSAVTDSDGLFNMVFTIESPIDYIDDGKIGRNFFRIYGNGQLILDEPPYPYEGIEIHEGYNELEEAIEIDITEVETESTNGVDVIAQNPTPPSRSLLLQEKFSPSGKAIPSDYTIKISIAPPPYEDVSEIEGEVISYGGQVAFSFALTHTPVKEGSLIITDGVEIFTDNGDGTLRGSEGGYGTVNYSSGEGSLLFFTPPEPAGDITANYSSHTSIYEENIGSATGVSEYNFTLVHADIIPASLTIAVDGAEILDDGSGNLSGTNWLGTINYTTGAIYLNYVGFVPPSSGDFLANYTYWGAVTPEVIAEGESTTQYYFTLVHHPIIEDTLSITDGVETFTDNGDGTLTGSEGGVGTINYPTGQGFIDFNTEPTWGTPIFATYSTACQIQEQHTNGDGYLQIETPVLPVVKIKDVEEDTIIDYEVVGGLDSRQDEFYLELNDGGSGLGPYYTLITDIHVRENALFVFDGNSTYYRIEPSIEIPSNATAVMITKKGAVYYYNETGGLPLGWNYQGALQFNSIQYPQNLNVVSDGIYAVSGTIGTVTTGTLGETSTVFENYIGIVNNSEAWYIDLAVSVFEPEADRPVKMSDFSKVMQGSMNLLITEVTADPYIAPDESPSIGEIQAVSGVTFTNPFLAFLNEKNLTTLEKVRKVGPLTYVNDYPEGVNANQLKTLQAHTDLYNINQNIIENQAIITANYPSLFKIATTPKNDFLNDVVGESLPLFKAAQIHEVTVQNMRMVTNMLSNTLSDMRMSSPSIAPVENSTFAESVLAKATSSCGCSDCTSMISPFAYLMDLIKYGSENLTYKVGTTTTYAPTNLSTFVSLIEGLFYQPFGGLDVDCETLHDEYCRVRLVTEIFEQVVDDTTLTTAKSNALATERNQYLTLVYQTLLVQASTSINEIRDVYNKQPADAKLEAVKKLAEKLKIPVYIPSTAFFTTDVLWLTIGNAITGHQLTAANLELIFGFRDTKRNVLTPTPTSYMETWRAAYLRDKWKSEDYLFNEFSREDVVPGNSATYKAVWKPLIDPDNIGWIDFTYTPYAYAKKLYKWRMKDTDEFFDYWLTDTNNTSRTAADLNKLILRVLDRDIVSHSILNNIVQIYNGTSWDDFLLFNRSLVGTDTDAILDKSEYPNIFPPLGTPPKMRYKRVVRVVSTVPQNVGPFTLTWPDPVIEDQIGYAKLISSGDATVFQTSDGSIASINFVNDKQVTLTLNAAPNANFVNGNIDFIYEVEVPLYNNTLIDPEKVTTELYSASLNYTFSPYTPSGTPSPFAYSVWNNLSAISAWTSLTGIGNYAKLKTLYQLVISGQVDNDQMAIITGAMSLDKDHFVKMVQLMIVCDNYHKSMYTSPEPTPDQLHELVSIFRYSAKAKLKATWVAEEIEHQELSIPINLMLNSQYFLKAKQEPLAGQWDLRLQTIPETTGAINSLIHTPILDPELISYNEINASPEASDFRDFWVNRKDEIKSKYDIISGYLMPYDALGYTYALNYINTGNAGSNYSIGSYATLQDLINDLQSSDPFKHKDAADQAWLSFRINADDFLYVAKIMDLYAQNDPLVPSLAEIEKTAKILTGGYKRLQLYGTSSSGWIEDEVTYDSGNPLRYYNVLKMRLAPGRSETTYREVWHNTLFAWNRQATIQPDLVPPQNIKNFVTTNWVYTAWNARKNDLLTDYNSIDTLFNSGLYSTVLFTNLKDLINLVIARSTDATFTPIALDYLPYFTDIASIEAAGEDIRPFLNLLNITIAEYRYLKKVYDILESETTPSTLSSLLETEYEDVINILIAIRVRYMSMELVIEEYDNDIILDQDYFQIYKAAPDAFPLTDLPTYNSWRSPLSLRRAWINTLQTRIDQEKAAKDKWQDVLMETEDRNMPFMRDALIRALMKDCETFDEAAERLAKTYFIETKDNCCVKHTRVSFAIETLQGLYWALETGVYDDFIANFTLSDPDFKAKWKWLGSYATWRSAVFVFLYPENLLYPTLKRKQSPAFVDLSLKTRDFSRLSPESACKLGHEFESYLNEIKTLDIKCSTNALAIFRKRNLISCCENETEERGVTYYFAQSINGRTFYCSKDYIDNSSEALDFWEKLNIQQGAKILGCFYFNGFVDLNTPEMESSLLMFYTYWNDAKLKVAYIKKVLSKLDSGWSEELDPGEIPAISGYTFKDIVAIQHNIPYERPTFAVTYTKNLLSTGGNTAIETVPFDVESAKFGNPKLIIQSNPYLDVNPLRKSFRFYLKNSSLSIQATCLVMDKRIYFRIPGMTLVASSQSYVDTWLDFNYYSYIIGAFASSEQDNTIIILFRANNGTNTTAKYTFSFTVSGSNVTITNISMTPHIPDSGILNLKSLALVFSHNDNFIPFFGINCYSSFTWLGSQISSPKPPATQVCNLKNTHTLIPQLSSNALVNTGDCIDDFSLRIKKIKDDLLLNMNASNGGTSVFICTRSTVVSEVLWEAYYFVPLLLALDQQRRGQFASALSWYKSIYDYTNPINSKRKIFYGLTLEESIVNTYTQASNWLLDPLNPHLVAQTRTNAYTKYTLMNIIQCLYAYADREFTIDTIETVPIARKLYTTALDLLNVKELNVKANECLTLAEACLTPEASTNRMWSGLLAEVKTKLSSLGDPVLIETLSHTITDLINEGDEETYASKFAEAFELIEENEPTPVSPNTVLDLIADLKNDTDNTARYLAAINNPSTFTEEVADLYALNVSRICSIPVDEISSEASVSKLQWLLEPVPVNTTDYTFNFASSTGVQNLSGNRMYNPANPTTEAYDANLIYSNAKAISTANPVNPSPVPADPYTPLITYKFCMPQNPIFKALLLKGNLELFKIFNCRNIAGMVRELDVFAAATDSTTGVPVIGASGNLVIPGAGTYSPTQYRFRVLLDRAKQIAQQAQQLESLFLAALEKEDAENYAQLRARQDLETAKATIKLQDLRIRQANSEKSLADLQLDKVVFIQSHYEGLLSAGLNSFEEASLMNLYASLSFTFAALGSNIAAASLAGVEAYYGKGNWSTMASNAAAAWGNLAGVQSILSSINSQLASFARRAEEWQFQSDLAGKDIGIANQQIKIAEDNIRIVGQEREISVLNTNHAEDSLNFLKNKFTNAELYNWMGRVLEQAYSYMLNISTATARTAESQLYFERQEQAGPFILDDYWELPSSGFTSGSSAGQPDRRGLTGSARLLVDIQRLDQYAFESNKRKLQLTKVISLAQNFPSEFQQFKESGVMNFELTNKFFDYDFPGHYLRLVNSVKTTVVGLLPVYDSIKATLTAEPTSYTVIGGTTFQKTPIKRLSVESVALTSANNASGLFELQPIQNQELLNPFEGMGIESRWEFKMPQFSNRIDYANIADVLITVEYTALDSFQYRYQVLQDLENALSFNRGFSFKNNFPDQWYELSQAVEGDSTFEVSFQLKREFFPQGIDNLILDQTKEMILFFSRADGFEEEIGGVAFNYQEVSVIPEDPTVDGKLYLSPNSTDPIITLKLVFDNTPENRELFSEEKVKDILLLVGCKAELKSYPL